MLNGLRTSLAATFILSASLAAAAAQPSKEGRAAALSQGDREIVRDLSAFLDKLAAKDVFSGAVLFAKGDQILFKGAYGYADHAFDAHNQVDTKFCLASMGKMFTGVAILQLAQQGKLSLNDTVAKLLPDYPDRQIAEKITVHHLLTHTSGLGSFFNPKFFDSSPTKFRTTASHLPLFAGEALQFEPGSRWSYSNSGFIVLGLIIEKVSGQSFDDYVTEHIFKPTGMLNTGNYDVDGDVPNRALGYTFKGDDRRMHYEKPRRTNILIHSAHGGASGGGYSTVEDLFRFSRALQKYQLLNREYTELDMTGKVATPIPDEKYAYAMFETMVKGLRIVGHGGTFAGVATQLDMYPDLGYTVVVLGNYDGGTRQIIDRLRFVLSGQKLPQAVQLPAGDLQAIAGHYAAGPGPMPGPPIQMQITVDGQGIVVAMGSDTPAHRFLPLSADEFFEEYSVTARLNVSRNDQGQVTGLKMTGAGPMPISVTRSP